MPFPSELWWEVEVSFSEGRQQSCRWWWQGTFVWCVVCCAMPWKMFGRSSSPVPTTQAKSSHSSRKLLSLCACRRACAPWKGEKEPLAALPSFPGLPLSFKAHRYAAEAPACPVVAWWWWYRHVCFSKRREDAAVKNSCTCYTEGFLSSPHHCLCVEDPSASLCSHCCGGCGERERERACHGMLDHLHSSRKEETQCRQKGREGRWWWGWEGVEGVAGRAQPK